jgi:hypothetical protein
VWTTSISKRGTINIPHNILDQLDWNYGDRIAVGYIASPLTLLLRKADKHQPGFTLSYQYRKPGVKAGGKITCSTFANQILRPKVVLPLRGIKVVILNTVRPPQLALQLETPTWVEEEFSQTGLSRIGNGIKGVYQLVSSSGDVLRIGEGQIATRIKEHLRETEFVSKVRRVRYMELVDKEEMELMERILLADYEGEFGKLPFFNLVRS